MSDYYPFGMQTPGRDTIFKTGYRYAFNGKEMDNNIHGEGNAYDFGARIYDPRVGKWYSTDLHDKAYLSPYQFARNSPVDIIDPDGNDEFHFHYLTTYNPVRTLGADGNFQTTYKPTTHTYVEVVKNNLANTFYVHRDIAKTNGSGTSSSTTTQFFPDAGAGMVKHSGVTYATYFGFINRPDNDYTSLLKILDDFPELQGMVGGSYIGTPGTRDANKDFWNKAYADKSTRAIAQREQEQVNSLMLGVVMSGVSELALTRIIAGASEAKAGETFYRAISKADYETFLKTGNIPATGETVISPTKEFAANYNGVLLEINTKEGTLSQLKQIGVRNAAAAHPNSGMPLVQSGWTNTNAFFKLETNSAGLSQVNIGLGKGEALNIFNNNIQSVKVLTPP